MTKSVIHLGFAREDCSVFYKISQSKFVIKQAFTSKHNTHFNRYGFLSIIIIIFALVT